MSSLFTGEFRKDVIRAVIVAIVAASIAASAIAIAADRYFGDTISSLIGEYGEYDLQLIVREDMAEPAMEQIRAIVRDRYPGVRIKESLSISGRKYVLIGLPPSLRNPQDIERFPVQFVNIPGYSGYGVMIEPRVEITGIDSRAVRDMLTEKCEQLQGVQFAFQHHGNIAVVLKDSAPVEQVTETISQLLKSYTLIDIRFPMSGQIDDLTEMENALAETIVERFGPRDIVSSSTIKDEELGDLTTALSEIRRFLTYYTTTIDIADTRRQLKVGEHIALASGSLNNGGTGDLPVIAMVIEAGDSTAKAVVIRGEVVDRQEYNAYEVNGDSLGEWLGLARATSEVRRLQYSLDNGIELLDRLSAVADKMHGSISKARQLLSNYWYVIDSLNSVKQSLHQVETLIDSVDAQTQYTSQARQLVSALKKAKDLVVNLNSGLETVTSLAGTVSEQEKNTSGLTRVIGAFERWQDSLSGYEAGLDALVLLLEDSARAKQFVSEMSEMTRSALDALYGLNVDEVAAMLDGVDASLRLISTVDVQAILSQLIHIRESLPSIKDEEVGRSLMLIDNYLGGQVIPGDRIQLVVTGNLEPDAVKQVISSELRGHSPIIAVTSLGTIQPGVRTQVLHMLGEVRATIAALASVVLTVVTLLFDHSSIIALLKKTAASRSVAGGMKVKMGPIYAGSIGATVLSATMAASGGSLPFVGPWMVFFIGACIGLGAYAVAEKVSPVNMDEVSAGIAMGLPWHQIMRDIVIPSGRPGILNVLNKSEVSF